ncbi:hypothetical protein PLESTB_001941800 [Pleodorina starrii]|uniref:RRM domain-containing protein n=1 Tax=Pleodorina starrii TaxID=330485 RepID=A0A9W6C369_9CHLO|nr:hypothetical protein PLESTM_001926000 [Pleodorina starrii]GLC62808.1 hypothetical protein PLESTB_001941800 [Pleodorina starrii]GLC77475.1 hypothetical protein PLESTF_001939800 [Pleodorina starrii]
MVVRLFVGGLPRDISAADLRSRFSPFGKVEAIEIVPQKQEEASVTITPSGGATATCRGFAYVELEPKDDISVHKCLSVYNHSKWRGNVLRVELAKPSYLARLHVEWQEQVLQEEQQLRRLQQREQEQQPGPANWFAAAPAAKTTVTKAAAPPVRVSPPAVSAASLAAAAAAAEAAAAKRAKAAARSSRPVGPVPPPAPADLSQPLQLANPLSRHRPIQVDLAQPAQPPRRSFPAVPSLPLSRLDWQRDDDFNEPLGQLEEKEGSGSGSEGCGSECEGPGEEEPALLLNIEQEAPPRKRSRTDNQPQAGRRSQAAAGVPGKAVSAAPPSVLYHLNRVLAQPMRPYVPPAPGGGVALAGSGGHGGGGGGGEGRAGVAAAAAAPSHGGAGVGAAVPPPQHPAFRQLQSGPVDEGAEEEEDEEEGAAMRDGAPLAKAAKAATTAPVASPAAAAAPVPPRREVRGEVLSMFKVLKAIDSESRKLSAQEAAGRLAAAKLAEQGQQGRGRSDKARGSGRAGEAARVPDKGQLPAAAMALATAGGREEVDGDDGAVVDFMDGEEGEAAWEAGGAGAGAGGGQRQRQELMQQLDRFGDSDDDEEEGGGAGGASRPGGRAGGGRGPAKGEVPRLTANAPAVGGSTPRGAAGRATPLGGQAARQQQHTKLQDTAAAAATATATAAASGSRPSPAAAKADKTASAADAAKPRRAICPPAAAAAPTKTGLAATGKTLTSPRADSRTAAAAAAPVPHNIPTELTAVAEGPQGAGRSAPTAGRKAGCEDAAAPRTAKRAAGPAVALSGQEGSRSAGAGEPAVARPRPAKRARSLAGGAEDKGGMGLSPQPRRASCGDMPLVPLGPQRGERRSGGPGSSGGVGGSGRPVRSSKSELLARFGGDSDSDGQEVFRDVDDSD